MNTSGGKRRFERGQAMVLIIFAILGLFAFAALAIDMGQIFMTRKMAQSAADAAAMAGARDLATGKSSSVAKDKAFKVAKANGMDNNQKTNWVTVNNAPVGGDYCGICDSATKKEYVQVIIKVRASPIFAHLFFQGFEQTTVEAISHGKLSDDLAGGDALLSLSPADDSFEMKGNNGVTINGGNIRSVGGMTKSGGSGNIVATNVYYGTSFSGHTSPITPTPVQNTWAGMRSFDPPYCPAASDPNWTTVSGRKTQAINGVNYYYYASGLTEGNLPAGIHCVNGGIDKGNYTGKDILIVLLSGGIKQTGGDSFDFRASASLVDKNGNNFGHMIFYVPETNTSELNFGGNSRAYLEGTLYAPGAFCDIGGNPNDEANRTAVICLKIRFHGNPAFVTNFNDSEQFKLPAMVELVQ